MSRREIFMDVMFRTGLMILVYVGFALFIPSYYSVRGVAALLDGAVVIGLTGLGIGVTMLAAEFDLSVGSLAALIGVVTLNFINGAEVGMVTAIVLGVVIAGVFGAAQGLVIAITGINSLVFTIGSLIGLRGLALFMSGENTVNIPVQRLEETDFLSASVLGIFSIPSLVMIGAFVLVAAFLRYTVWGKEVLAIGGGRTEARAAGVSIKRAMVVAFAISGALAGLAGAISCVKLGSATPLGFDTLLLSAVTACLIGGIALEGGRGTVTGIFVGLLTLRFLVGGVSGLGAPFWMQNLAVGSLLIVVIVAQLSVRQLKSRHDAPALPVH
ncbi:ABC transporter permease [Shinella daejeonensis]|uniref:ABC transporter permease n=1 Tax=Shinella daejeonensis TaxID=659017 RepID=UPI0020C79F83|nr:ABC transporter permease [Shinella daejeonensis]MCP8894571.1 ABC transporter permease [Shinella daejeonensis]